MIDITRALANGHPNWPGDTPFALTPTARIAEGASVNLMQLSTSTHCGTHLDAPYHYREDGQRLGSIPLALLVGRCRVIDVRAQRPVTPRAAAGPLPERVLFYTGQPARWERFPSDFTPLTPELIDHLAAQGVRLVGTDAPSVDAFDSQQLPVHRACAERGLVILEGLQLSGVAPGEYELICLPLALPEADAAPVRAVLR